MVGYSTLILPCILGIVELNVICLAFYVEGNISTLVTGYCKSNRRGFVWGGVLELSAAVEGGVKSFSISGPVYTNVVQQ